MKKLNIAIIGQGRSGRDIHGAYLKSENNTKFNVTAIVERDPKRRKRALEEYPGCEVFENYTELFAKNDIDLVTNASFSNEHFEVTKDLIEHGFNVIVEKPFARNFYECDTLIRLAKEKGVYLGVFQQSFLAPYYIKAKEIIQSGVLGDIKQIDVTFNGFARRWDWQTVQVKMGGNAYNTGPHPIGLALGFLDFDESFKVEFSRLGRVLNSGDADDYAKIILSAPNKPVVDVEISSNDAFPASTLKILGSRGTYSSSITNYKLKYITDGENPERELILKPLEDENGYPAYCTEKLVYHTDEGEIKGTAFDVGTGAFYEMMYNAVTKGEEMSVKPEHAAMIIRVIEQVHAENPLPVKF